MLCRLDVKLLSTSNLNNHFIIKSLLTLLWFCAFMYRIDVQFVIKVADFGLSESIGSKEYFRQDKSSVIKLPIKWLAPESMEDYVFSEESDVVSQLMYALPESSTPLPPSTQTQKFI